MITRPIIRIRGVTIAIITTADVSLEVVVGSGYGSGYTTGGSTTGGSTTGGSTTGGT